MREEILNLLPWILFGGILVTATIIAITKARSGRATPTPPPITPVVATPATPAGAAHPTGATPATPAGAHDDDHYDHHHAHAGGNGNTGWWILVFFILGVLLIVSMHILGNKAIENKLVEPPKKERGCYYCMPGSLLPRQEYIVSPGQTWTSEFVDYKFKFRSESGAPYEIKFTGMTHFVLREKDGLMPEGAKPGPVQIRLPKNATRSVKIQLYRICEEGDKVCP